MFQCLWLWNRLLIANDKLVLSNTCWIRIILIFQAWKFFSYQNLFQNPWYFAEIDHVLRKLLLLLVILTEPWIWDYKKQICFYISLWRNSHILSISVETRVSQNWKLNLEIPIICSQMKDIYATGIKLLQNTVQASCLVFRYSVRLWLLSFLCCSITNFSFSMWIELSRPEKVGSVPMQIIYLDCKPKVQEKSFQLFMWKNCLFLTAMNNYSNCSFCLACWGRRV